ncbi:hypothetical protein D3C87_1511980 [compost metagenome]
MRRTGSRSPLRQATAVPPCRSTAGPPLANVYQRLSRGAGRKRTWPSCTATDTGPPRSLTVKTVPTTSTTPPRVRTRNGRGSSGFTVNRASPPASCTTRSSRYSRSSSRVRALRSTRLAAATPLDWSGIKACASCPAPVSYDCWYSGRFQYQPAPIAAVPAPAKPKPRRARRETRRPGATADGSSKCSRMPGATSLSNCQRRRASA